MCHPGAIEKSAASPISCPGSLAVRILFGTVLVSAGAEPTPPQIPTDLRFSVGSRKSSALATSLTRRTTVRPLASRSDRRFLIYFVGPEPDSEGVFRSGRTIWTAAGIQSKRRLVTLCRSQLVELEQSRPELRSARDQDSGCHLRFTGRSATPCGDLQTWLSLAQRQRQRSYSRIWNPQHEYSERSFFLRYSLSRRIPYFAERSIQGEIFFARLPDQSRLV
jgi:hypothetical protein